MRLPPDAAYVMIHDGARCLVTEDVIRRVKDSVEPLRHGCGGHPRDGHHQAGERGRAGRRNAGSRHAADYSDTQGFRVPLLAASHRRAREEHFEGTDRTLPCWSTRVCPCSLWRAAAGT